MRKTLIWSLVLVLTGCATAPVEVSTTSAGEELAAIQQGLDRVRWQPDRSETIRLRDRAEALSRRPALGRQLAIDSLFAAAEASRLINDPGRLRDHYQTLQALAADNPLTFVVASWLEGDPAKALEILEKAPSQPAPHPRAILEKAILLAGMGRHAQAVGYFDTALEGLPAVWRGNVSGLREKSWALRHSQPETPTLEALLGKDQILVSEFTAAAAALTPQPDSLDLGPGQSVLTRARLAQWILHVAAVRENNPGLKTRYTDRLAARPGSRSPIGDVPAESPFLDAVMVAVERNLLQLPDGRNFQPERPVSGLELKGALDRVRGRYP